MSHQDRHAQLLAAGWTYDAAADHYLPPGSPTDGTARVYNLPAAWRAHQAAQAAAAAPAADAPPTRRADPRRQEPQ